MLIHYMAMHEKELPRQEKGSAFCCCLALGACSTILNDLASKVCNRICQSLKTEPAHDKNYWYLPQSTSLALLLWPLVIILDKNQVDLNEIHQDVLLGLRHSQFQHILSVS